MKEIDPEEAQALRTSELFDAEWYLKQYPDVRALGMDPLEHYLWIGRRLGRRASGNLDDAPSEAAASAGSVDPPPRLPQRTPDSSPKQIVSKPEVAAYLALRQEVLESGLWDERSYLSRYYEQYTASKRGRPRKEPFFPLDYYLQEGWKLGHEPSTLLPIHVDQKHVGCSKLEYFLNRLRFDGYQFDEDIWAPSRAQIEEYSRLKRQRNSKKVIYTCIVQGYDAATPSEE